MRKVRYRDALNIKLSPAQRAAVEKLAETNEITLGAAARELLDLGIRAKALE